MKSTKTILKQLLKIKKGDMIMRKAKGTNDNQQSENLNEQSDHIKINEE